ncbi:hypothetical protein C2S51_009036 [Perilla frutescens var. frutescens]|nr:hypothetical protein C2S51_009036 [Perilla frutescens var. frutescens]
MAYAALVSLEQTIDQIMNHDQYSTSPQEKQLIISLDKYVISLQAFLEDFPEKGSNLEGRIRDVSTAAEDIIECFMLEQIRSSYECNKQARFKLEPDLNKVAKKMESVVADAVEIKNIMIKDEQLGNSYIASSSSGVAPAGKVDMVDDDLMKIKERLIGQSSQLQFLSIVGMGGIGKTTLAKNAYDDQLIQEHFQIRAWVHKAKGAEEGNKSRKLSGEAKIAEKGNKPRAERSKPSGEAKKAEKGNKQAEAEPSKQDDESNLETSESNEEMAERVYKTLIGRRYIIVMDDMWSTEVLDNVKRLFPDDSNGSRIMLTTRLSDVAAYADSSIPPYEMQLMDEDQSWNLFRHKVFTPPELEIIGREIATSCRGLPLAVVVIAGVLSTTSKSPDLWGEIAKNINSTSSKDERLEKRLSLSFNLLPHRLRPCLLYMGAFPEYYRIRVSELIRLWIAEGFLKHPNGSCKSFEEGAEEYLEDLVRRNLILVTEMKCNGKIKSCRLHDMVRDTCIRLLEKENNLRHVTENSRTDVPLSMRSILRFEDIDGPFEHFRLLRILHVPKFKYRLELPPRKVLTLFQLRYLAFTCHWIPAAIANFQNLQTLVIVSHANLPSSIWKMSQLRHLIFSGYLPYPEEATHVALENLQTLKECGLVGCNLSRRFLKAIGTLPNLEALKLINCSLRLLHWEVRGGEFPQLKYLLIDEVEFKTLVTEDSSVLPRLKCLRLHNCIDLEEISDDIGEIPTLELIEVKDCGLAVYDWAKRVEEEQQSYGNDTLQVHCNW